MEQRARQSAAGPAAARPGPAGHPGSFPPGGGHRPASVSPVSDRPLAAAVTRSEQARQAAHIWLVCELAGRRWAIVLQALQAAWAHAAHLLLLPRLLWGVWVAALPLAALPAGRRGLLGLPARLALLLPAAPAVLQASRRCSQRCGQLSVPRCTQAARTHVLHAGLGGA